MAVLKNQELEDFFTNLKEIGKGEQGQYIKLVDIGQIESKLIELKEESKLVKVTKENYKASPKKIEAKLRNSRYTLQRIYKVNTKFLNEIKKKEKEELDKLIGLIKPEEERIKKNILHFENEVKREKELERVREEKRIKRINEALFEAEKALELSFIKAKEEGDLGEYDGFLRDLKGGFESFEEFEFNAKRLHAIYTAKREDIIKRIESAKKEAREREERQMEVYLGREKELLKMGFVLQGERFLHPRGEVVVRDEVIKNGELWFLDLIGKVREGLTSPAKKEEESTKSINREIVKGWEDLLVVFKGLGGDISGLILKRGQLPTKEGFKSIRESILAIKKERKLVREEVKEEVKEELLESRDKILGFLEALEKGLTGFRKYPKSAEILQRFINKTLEVVRDVFGEVYNN